MRVPYWRYRYDGTDLLMAAAAGYLLGALTMFIFDPEQGRRRRALMRDKMVHYGNQASDLVSGTAQDLRNRAQGVAAETRGMVRESLATETGSQPTTPL
jgi:gas vesicle protein